MINQKISEKQSYLILFLIAVSMALISWQKWPDLLVDYGVQVYLPWQLIKGKVLYKDIAYLYGPASVYFHALVFKLLGPGILILSGINLLIIAGLTFLIYKVFLKIGSPCSALITSITFLTVFAFSQYILTGNYNFVCPYYYELTHAIFLSFLVIHRLSNYLEKHRMTDLIIMGSITGLIFLTKTEVFLAEFVSIIFCLTIALKFENLPKKVLIQKIMWFAGACLIFPVIFIAYFSIHMPIHQALVSIITPWIYTANDTIRGLPYFQSIMGTDDPSHNIARMAFFTILIIACFGLLFFLNHLIRNQAKYARQFSVIASFIFAGLAIGFFYSVPWFELTRPLPLFIGVLGLYLIRGFITNAEHTELHRKNLTFLCLTVFSFLLMLKMVLNVHVQHYGFALTLPATLVFIKVILDELPNFAKKISGTAVFFKTVCLTLIFLYIAPHIWVSYNYYQKKIFPIGEGVDTIYTYSPYFQNRGLIVKITLDYIKEHLDSDASFSAFPHSVMFNYLLRRDNPSKFIFYNPLEWKLFGDDQIIKSLHQNSPRYILLTDMNFEEFGYKYFGKDYAKILFAWIQKNYVKVKLIGQEPFSGKGFGIQIMEKRPDTLLN